MENVEVIAGTAYEHVVPALLMEKSFISACKKSDLPSSALARQLVIAGICPSFLSMANVWFVHGGMLFLVAVMSQSEIYISAGVDRHQKGNVVGLYALIHEDDGTKVWGVLTDEDKEFISEEL